MIKYRIKGWVGQVTRWGKRISAYRGLVRKSKGNRPSSRLEDNIKNGSSRNRMRGTGLIWLRLGTSGLFLCSR